MASVKQIQRRRKQTFEAKYGLHTMPDFNDGDQLQNQSFYFYISNVSLKDQAAARDYDQQIWTYKSKPPRLRLKYDEDGEPTFISKPAQLIPEVGPEIAQHKGNGKVYAFMIDSVTEGNPIGHGIIKVSNVKVTTVSTKS